MGDILNEIKVYAANLHWDYIPATWEDVANRLEKENTELRKLLSEGFESGCDYDFNKWELRVKEFLK